MSFNRWRQRVLPQGHISATWRIRLNLRILRPTGVHNRNGKWIGLAIFAQLTAESAYTLQWAPLFIRIAPSHGGYGPARCFWPMRAHKPNGTPSVQPSLHRWPWSVYYLQWFAYFPLKIAPSHVGIWTSCNTWLFGPTRVPNTNGNLIVSAVFLQGSLLCDTLTERQKDRRTDHTTRCDAA